MELIELHLHAAAIEHELELIRAEIARREEMAQHPKKPKRAEVARRKAPSPVPGISFSRQEGESLEDWNRRLKSCNIKSLKPYQMEEYWQAYESCRIHLEFAAASNPKQLELQELNDDPLSPEAIRRMKGNIPEQPGTGQPGEQD